MTDAPAPTAPADVEAQARALREARAAECLAAIRLVLQQYHCRLSTTQTITDGQAGPVTVIVSPLP